MTETVQIVNGVARFVVTFYDPDGDTLSSVSAPRIVRTNGLPVSSPDDRPAWLTVSVQNAGQRDGRGYGTLFYVCEIDGAGFGGVATYFELECVVSDGTHQVAHSFVLNFGGASVPVIQRQWNTDFTAGPVDSAIPGWTLFHRGENADLVSVALLRKSKAAGPTFWNCAEIVPNATAAGSADVLFTWDAVQASREYDVISKNIRVTGGLLGSNLGIMNPIIGTNIISPTANGESFPGFIGFTISSQWIFEQDRLRRVYKTHSPGYVATQDTTPFVYPATREYYQRSQVRETAAGEYTARAKFWTGGLGDEPATWALSRDVTAEVTASGSAGKVGLVAFENFGSDVAVIWMCVAVDGYDCLPPSSYT